MKQLTQVLFLSKSDITSDIKELLQQLTIMDSNGLSEPHCQAQKQERSHLISLAHSFITTIGYSETRQNGESKTDDLRLIFSRQNDDQCRYQATSKAILAEVQILSPT